MITEIEIQNFKTIKQLKLELGRVNVLIGENGSGKSNILEAVALAGAALAGKLDNEFLSSRGMRVTGPELMRAVFEKNAATMPIKIGLKSGDDAVSFELHNDNSAYSKWQVVVRTINGINRQKQKQKTESDTAAAALIGGVLGSLVSSELGFLGFLGGLIGAANAGDKVAARLADASTRLKIGLQQFVIYSPENSALRIFQKEGQIEPLGVNGEGLLKLLTLLAENEGPFGEIKQRLQLLGWFDDMQLRANQADSRIDLIDKYLADSGMHIDHRSANEGFFFLLFYFTLFSTDLTPPFFAVDNIDASLNPKLCQRLTVDLVQLAKENNKQAILTTHNPAVLDGLNLDDDEQRLFVVTRDPDGASKIRRIHKPQSAVPLRLSEMFLRGTLGGLPKAF
jgi:predicted ATPase